MISSAITGARKYNAPGSDRFGLILFSHGSLLCGAGAALAEHAIRLRQVGGFAAVEVGYLNYSAPTFERAVQRLSAAEVSRVVVAPFFLVPGYFVTTSLPRKLAEVGSDYPAMKFMVASCLGSDDRLADALISHALAPRPAARWRDGLWVDPRTCLIRHDCPVRGTSGCPGTLLTQTPDMSADQSGSSPDAECDDSPMLLGESEVKSTDALLVLVHGSPKAEANTVALKIVDGVKRRNVFPIVQAGFLECEQPSIPDAIKECIRAGARRITAIPCFLHVGTHVASDLPNAIDEARATHPDVEFRMGQYLGMSPLVTDVILDRAREALEDEAANVAKGSL